jgi:hypothetical protein
MKFLISDQGIGHISEGVLNGLLVSNRIAPKAQLAGHKSELIQYEFRRHYDRAADFRS